MKLMGLKDGEKSAQTYFDALQELSEVNPAFANAIKLIEKGLKQENRKKEAENELVAQASKEQLNTTVDDIKVKAEDAKEEENMTQTEKEAVQKAKNLERVIKEIKKQLASYK